MVVFASMLNGRERQALLDLAERQLREVTDQVSRARAALEDGLRLNLDISETEALLAKLSSDRDDVERRVGELRSLQAIA